MTLSMRRTLLWLAAFIAIEALSMLFIDRPVALYLRGVDARDTGFIDIFRSYTDAAKGMWYLWPSGIGCLICVGLWRIRPDEKRAAFLHAAQKFGFFFACVALSGIATDIIKRLAGRARPIELMKDNIYGFFPLNTHYAFNSWPSGHATTAFAVGFALAALWPRQRVLFHMYAFLLSLSRIMVNAHYVSDVIAGAAVGALTVVFMHERFRRRGIEVNSHC